MNNENRNSFDQVIKFLMNYCYSHQIGVVYNKDLPSAAHSRGYNYPSDLVVVNGNWKPEKEVPFIFAHEIGHVIDNNSKYYHLAYLGMDRGEYSANTFALNLLEFYCLQNDIWFDTIYQFANAFGIPKDKYYLLDNLQTGEIL